MLKKTFICCAMIGAVALAVASSGGGSKKKSEIPLKPAFTPIRTTHGFTLKAGPIYTGSRTLSAERNKNYITYNTLVTYQKGNTVIILPRQTKLSTSSAPTYKSNLNLLTLKLRLKK